MKKGLAQDTRTTEHDQVPLGGPLCSRNPNTGMGGQGGKRAVHRINKGWGHDRVRMTLQSRCEGVMSKAEHNAWPNRRRGGFAGPRRSLEVLGNLLLLMWWLHPAGL